MDAGRWSVGVRLCVPARAGSRRGRRVRLCIRELSRLPAAGIAAEPTGGNVWVTLPNGFQRLLASGGTQSYGGLSGGRGIALDGSGNLVIADRGASNVKVFSPSGSPIRNWAVGGQPYGVDLDGSGNVYVTDSTNNQVKKYTPLRRPDRNLRDFWGRVGAVQQSSGHRCRQDDRRCLRRRHRQRAHREARLERQLRHELGHCGHGPRAIRQHARWTRGRRGGRCVRGRRPQQPHPAILSVRSPDRDHRRHEGGRPGTDMAGGRSRDRCRGRALRDGFQRKPLEQMDQGRPGHRDADQ